MLISYFKSNIHLHYTFPRSLEWSITNHGIYFFFQVDELFFFSFGNEKPIRNSFHAHHICESIE